MKYKFRKIIAFTAVMLLACGILTGCGTPSGFIKSKGDMVQPLIYNGDRDNAIYDLRDQFPDENSKSIGNGSEYSEIFFVFGNEKWSICFNILRSADNPCDCDGISVFLNDTKKGSFVEIPNEWRVRSATKYLSTGGTFLFENHLFYCYTKYQQKSYMMDWRDNFYRCEFYRHDISTGKNEEIKLTQFATSLQSIDNKWAINPDYKGEK